MPFEFMPLAIPEVILIKPKVFGDSRGHFIETYHEHDFKKHGITKDFVQDNQSRSVKDVLRGLHYQLKHPQGKLVRVTEGKVLDIAVDIRQGSTTFGQAVSVIIDAEQHHQLYIPPGFAHGFSVLSETVTFLYKCTDFYHPEDECGVAWNDPALKIDWQVANPILSEKDKKYNPLSEIPTQKLPVMVES